MLPRPGRAGKPLQTSFDAPVQALGYKKAHAHPDRREAYPIAMLIRAGAPPPNAAPPAASPALCGPGGAGMMRPLV